MNVLTVTTSARGHAIVAALARSSHTPRIVAVTPARNPGIAMSAARMVIEDVMNFDAIVNVAEEESIDFAIIGPENPICGGLADRLAESGIPSVAPTRSLARIESSKGFTRDLLKKHDIDVSPAYRVFTEVDDGAIMAFIDELGGDYVVKYDALKGGKGVKVSGEHLRSIEEGLAYAIECIKEGGRVVIEEKLIGAEFSLISLVSGEVTVDCPAIQDHKRADEGDTGPNTGGMGTYGDVNHGLPFLNDDDIAAAKNINRRVSRALQDECGETYRGVLYGGFIATKDGVKLIEYNCRFGDPEALNILPLLETDFVDACTAIIDGSLNEDSIAFARKATVCRYVTPRCYPDSKDLAGESITLPAETVDVKIFHGDISEGEDRALRLGGSRTAGIVGIGDSIEEAQQRCLAACESVTGPVRFRKDIGTSALIQKRIDLMRDLRSG